MKPTGRVLYVGHAYYNAWYLSRALRQLGWRADVLNWDTNPANQGFYHGEDFRFTTDRRRGVFRNLLFYVRALWRYDVFHFSNANGLRFGNPLHNLFARLGLPGGEIRLLKRLGKKIVYSGNGCLDGVTQTSFASWGETPVCLDCPWIDKPEICSDETNTRWGRFRNDLADFQILLGGNRADFNLDPRVHEVPEFYCLDPDFWRPGLPIPSNYKLPLADSTVKIYHAVGNADLRTNRVTARNLKSTHIYKPLIEEMKADGHDVEMIFFQDVPNRELRFYQAQADIVVDMLTFGFFGATAREAMMLGKPVVCHIRREWLEQMRAEIPEYADELPVVDATPETVSKVLVDLVNDPEARAEIGRRSREFAVKWHSAEAGATRFDAIYRGLLSGAPGSDDFR
ncbi:MAG TPA: hypothetical protein VEX39_07760 [Thermoleophilaceae bacterium]|nr:hypothetical protein [Thermoleophilaceae bacterium]